MWVFGWTFPQYFWFLEWFFVWFQEIHCHWCILATSMWCCIRLVWSLWATRILRKTAVDVVHYVFLIVFADDYLFWVDPADVVSSAGSIDLAFHLIKLFRYDRGRLCICRIFNIVIVYRIRLGLLTHLLDIFRVALWCHFWNLEVLSVWWLR